MTLAPIRVFVIAPPITWWGLEHLLQSAHPRIQLVGMAPSVEEIVGGLRQHAIDVLLLDLDADHVDRSVQTLFGATHAKLLLVTDSGNEAILDQAVIAGLRGVVRKSDPLPVLLDAIQRVSEGDLWLDSDAPGRIFTEMARMPAKDADKGKLLTVSMRER